MHFHRYSPTAATVSAEWSGNTIKLNASLLRQIIVKAASASTVFTFTLTDNKDRIVRKWTDVTEVINDLTPMPAEGIYTAAISAATADEGFTVYLCFSENI